MITDIYVLGDTEISITGSGFGSSAYGDGVTVDGVAAEIVSYTDSEIVATLPAKSQGTYNLRVKIDSQGFADSECVFIVIYIGISLIRTIQVNFNFCELIYLLVHNIYICNI